MISVKQLEEFKKYVSNVALLLEIEITSTDGEKITEYYTTFDISVVDKDTNIVYNPLNFQIEAYQYQVGLSVDNLKLVIDNVNLSQTALELNKDQRGNNVSIGYAMLDDSGNVLGLFEIFSGRIANVEIDNKQAVFTIKHELLWWNNTTLRLHTLNLFPNQKDLKQSNIMKWGSK